MEIAAGLAVTLAAAAPPTIWGMPVAAFGALVAAASAALGYLLKWALSGRTDNAAKLVDAAVAMNAGNLDRLSRVESCVEELRHELNDAGERLASGRSRIDALEHENRALRERLATVEKTEMVANMQASQARETASHALHIAAGTQLDRTLDGESGETPPARPEE